MNKKRKHSLMRTMSMTLKKNYGEWNWEKRSDNEIIRKGGHLPVECRGNIVWLKQKVRMILKFGRPYLNKITKTD